MKTFIIFFALAVCSLSAQEKKSTAAVLDFRVISGITAQEAAALTSKFRNSVARTGKFAVIEREKMDQILKEQDFKMTDMCNSAECAVQVGQLLAAEKMLTGDIGKVGSTYSITVRIINVTTSRVEAVQEDEYKGDPDGLLTRFDILAQKITGTYKKSNTKWYILGGVLAAGGAAAAVLLGGGKSGGASGFPSPPKPQ